MSRRQAKPQVENDPIKDLIEQIFGDRASEKALFEDWLKVQRANKESEEADSAKVFDKMPPEFTSDRIADIQQLLQHAARGDVEIIQLEVLFKYYHKIEQEPGYDFRKAYLPMYPVGKIGASLIKEGG